MTGPAPNAGAGRRSLGVAVVGFGWMGRAHTQAYARVLHHFPQLRLRPRLVAVVDEETGRAVEAAEQFGFELMTGDWREIAADSRVGAVSITVPNYLHREIGVAMARAGKHIWVEKPAGLGPGDTVAIADALEQAGTQGAVGFNYRNAPAVMAAREIIATGRLGRITHAHFQFFSDYAAHPEGALTWRFERARGGSGVLGDLASHGVDLAWFLLGEVASVMADTAIFLPQRARPSGPTTGHTRSAGGAVGPVENEDYMACLLRMASGARAVLEVSRVSVGEQNAYGFQVHGTNGALWWDFRRMNELNVGTGTDYQDQSMSTVFVGPAHGYYGAFQPGSAISMSYDDLKVIEAYEFLRSIADHEPHGATMADAVRAAHLVQAIERSAETGAWVSPPAG